MSVQSRIVKWGRESTLCLLKWYKNVEYKFSDPKTKKKTLWQEISDELQKEGFSFDAEKCERKMINLKRDYKAVIDHNNSSGNDRKTFAYYEELNDIFGMKPSVKPVSVSSSMNSTNSTNGHGLSTSATKETKQEKKRKRHTDSHEIAEAIHALNEKANERLVVLENMQKQQMEMFSSFLEVIKKRCPNEQ